MARKINTEGLRHIMQWEGLKLEAYRDAGGVWTIGYGHTSRSGPPQVVAGMTVTRAQARKILQADLARFEERVNRLVKVDLSDNQFAALVSFDFNTGALHRSTLLKRLNAGDDDAVPGELMKWTRAQGRRLQGLANRRAAEAGLWARGAFVASAYNQARHTTRPLIDRQSVSWAASLFSSVAASVSGSQILQYALAGMAGVGFLAGLALFIASRKGA